jgi:hypothetical protein
MAINPQYQFGTISPEQQKFQSLNPYEREQALLKQRYEKQQQDKLTESQSTIRVPTTQEDTQIKRDALLQQIGVAKKQGLDNGTIQQMVSDNAPDWAKNSIVNALAHYDWQQNNQPGYLDKIVQGSTEGMNKAERNFQGTEQAYQQGKIGGAERFLENAGTAAQKMFLPIKGATEAVFQPVSSLIGGILNKAGQASDYLFPKDQYEQGFSPNFAPSGRPMDLTLSNLSPEARRKFDFLKDTVSAAAVPAGYAFTGTSLPGMAEKFGKAGILAGNKLGKIGDVISNARITESEYIIAKSNKLSIPQQNDFKKITGNEYVPWMRERGIINKGEETVGELIDRFNKLKDSEDMALAAVPGRFSDGSITRVAHELRNFYAKTESKNLGKIEELIKKSETEGLTMKEIIDIKRQYERNVKTGYFREKNSVKIAKATNRDKALREFAYNEAQQAGFTNLPEIAKEIQATRKLADQLGRNYAPGMSEKWDLMDNLLAVGGTANPEAWGLLIGKNIIQKSNLTSKLARMLNPSEAKNIVPTAPMIPQRKLLTAPAEEALRSEVRSLGSQAMPSRTQSTIDAAENMRLKRPQTSSPPASYLVELLRKIESRGKVPVSVSKSPPKIGRPPIQRDVIQYGAPREKLSPRNTKDIRTDLSKGKYLNRKFFLK